MTAPFDALALDGRVVGPAPALAERSSLPLEQRSENLSLVENRGAGLEDAVVAQLELAALHDAFIERQAALHVRVLELLAPLPRR